MKRKTQTEDTISPGREEEFEDNLSINERLEGGEKEKNEKKLEEYKEYVKKAALKIKEIAGKYCKEDTFET